MYHTEVAKLILKRQTVVTKNSTQEKRPPPLHPTVTPTRNCVMPKAHPKASPLESDKKSADVGGMLQNLRFVIGANSGHYYRKSDCKPEFNKSNERSLAGDPRHLSCCHNIRAEILEKWIRRPQPDVQREWLKNIMFY